MAGGYFTNCEGLYPLVSFRASLRGNSKIWIFLKASTQLVELEKSNSWQLASQIAQLLVRQQVWHRHRIPIKPKGRSSLTLAVWSSVWVVSYLLQRQHWASISRLPSHHGCVGKGCTYPSEGTFPSVHSSQGSHLATGCSSRSWHTDKGISVKEPELLWGNCWPLQVQLAVTRSLRQPPRQIHFCTHIYWNFHCTMYCVY